MHNTGQIQIDLECVILTAKDIFLQLAFSNPEFKLHYYFFMQEQTDHNTIKKDVGQCVWLFVSLWRSLERKDCMETKAGKGLVPLHLFLEESLLKK